MTKSEHEKQRQRLLRKWYDEGEEGGVNCAACGRWHAIVIDGKKFRSSVTVDHIKGIGAHPDKAGDDKNTQPLCMGCNVNKGGRVRWSRLVFGKGK